MVVFAMLTFVLAVLTVTMLAILAVFFMVLVVVLAVVFTMAALVVVVFSVGDNRQGKAKNSRQEKGLFHVYNFLVYQ
ncbi:hypothetical protein CFR76_04535 [Komagataeibacter swingsii]|uniref:Uncharacterized protein n=2 Tax=Komagataeibacter swingsii TaxID=215220 RepID=A0A2V4RFB7_9PROT|nr:hypothetical protein CFR76_04535 [Komagataeibacter swingsii]